MSSPIGDCWAEARPNMADGGKAACGKPDGTFLVALSGGADSVALLRMLIDKGQKVEAAHCNFHLRGEESDRDEAFCKAHRRRKDVIDAPIN